RNGHRIDTRGTKQAGATCRHRGAPLRPYRRALGAAVLIEGDVEQRVAHLALRGEALTVAGAGRCIEVAVKVGWRGIFEARGTGWQRRCRLALPKCHRTQPVREFRNTDLTTGGWGGLDVHSAFAPGSRARVASRVAPRLARLTRATRAIA